MGSYLIMQPQPFDKEKIIELKKIKQLGVVTKEMLENLIAMLEYMEQQLDEYEMLHPEFMGPEGWRFTLGGK